MPKSNLFKYFFSSYSSIFTLSSSRLGIALALITLIHPNVGICGLLGLCFATLYLLIIDSSRHEVIAKSTLRNCLLIGLLIGDLFALNFYILFFLAIFIFLTLVITTALESLFTKAYLPTLSLPFCLVGLIIFILLPQIYEFTKSPTSIWNVDISHLLPNFLTYFFHSIASLLLSTNPTVGIIFWLAIAFISPLSAIFLFLGFAIGNGFELLFHSSAPNLSFYSNGLNYSLIFTAIAGVFLSPSRFSIFLATFATLITSVIVMVSARILNPWYLPILSLPFNLVTLAILLSLRTLRPSALNSILFGSPEENFENSELLKNRHRFGEIGIFLPVMGKWKIQQAFNSDSTHCGLWQHGLDFVAANEKGEIFKNKGFELTDHFSFGKEIFSPIEGWVVDCVSNNKDNNIGQVDNNKSWGNYIILKSHYGIFVSLLHLKKDSLVVASGDFVKVGQKLAECGNSGYSPEPHLHLNIQNQAMPGSATLPFHLLNYAIDKKIHFHRTPLKDELIENLNLNCVTEKIFNFKIGEKFIFERSDKVKITIENKMDEKLGSFYFTDGITKIYHTKIGVNFYFYGFKSKKHSALCDLMVAASRVPLIYGKEFEYSDQLPTNLTHKFSPNFFGFLKKIFGLRIKNNQSTYVINKDGLTIRGTHNFSSGKVTSLLKIDPVSGIEEFAVGDKKYVRSHLRTCS